MYVLCSLSEYGSFRCRDCDPLTSVAARCRVGYLVRAAEVSTGRSVAADTWFIDMLEIVEMLETSDIVLLPSPALPAVP